jgi:hypothetical protein
MLTEEQLQTFVKPLGDRMRIQLAIQDGRWQAFIQKTTVVSPPPYEQIPPVLITPYEQRSSKPISPYEPKPITPTEHGQTTQQSTEATIVEHQQKAPTKPTEQASPSQMTILSVSYQVFNTNKW